MGKASTMSSRSGARDLLALIFNKKQQMLYGVYPESSFAACFEKTPLLVPTSRDTLYRRDDRGPLFMLSGCRGADFRCVCEKIFAELNFFLAPPKEICILRIRPRCPLGARSLEEDEKKKN